MATTKELVKEIDDYTVSKKQSFEPALKVGSVATGVASIVVLVKVFFPNLMTEGQWEALTAFLLTFLPAIAAIIIRRKVWSPASVVKVMDEAVKEAAARQVKNPPAIPTRKRTDPPNSQMTDHPFGK